MSATAGQESLTIDPAPARWFELLGARSSRPLVIMTGHQAEFWHPGILAKYLAADAAARAMASKGCPASVAWLVADQDSNDPSRIAYPMSSPAGPTKGAWQVPLSGGASASTAVIPDTPAAALPPLAPPAGAVSGLNPALPSVADGLVRIAESLRAHKDEPSAARQITGSLQSLLASVIQPTTITFASDLSRSDGFSQLLDRMRSDPVACARAYNDAAGAFPQAHVRPLVIEGAHVELPLWRMPEGKGRPRRAVFAADLAGIPLALLAPRALLMTALVRLTACDLFIHGLGGGLYDQVTDAWFSRWLPGRMLAPTAVVSATRLLPFDIKPPAPEAITRARWEAHHALHNPADLGDQPGAARKQQLLHELRTARSRGQSPSIAFKEMHTLLDKSRAEHQGALASLQAGAAHALEQRALAKVVYERTWPFPLYPDSTIKGLKAEIDRAFALMP